MSQMIPQPPPSIQVGGPAGGGPQPGGPAGPGAGDADAQNVTSLLKKALALVNQAAAAEADDIDASAIHKLAAGISQQIAAEQKLTDDVMGAGPGVKMVRKASGGGAPPGGPAAY